MGVGARPADILWQFLCEAMVLCLIGGAVGILLGLVSSMGRHRDQGLADGNIGAGHCGVGCGVRGRGHRFRLLPRVEGVATGSHRRAEIRMRRGEAKGTGSACFPPCLSPDVH